MSGVTPAGEHSAEALAFRRDLLGRADAPATWWVRVLWCPHAVLLRWKRCLVAPLLLVLLVLGGTATSQLDVALGTMHVAGDRSFTASSLLGPTPFETRAWSEAADGWCTWARGVSEQDAGETAETRGCASTTPAASPRTLLFSHALVDLVAVAVPVALLVWLTLWHTRRYASRWRSRDAMILQLLAIGLGLPIAYFGTELVELIAMWILHTDMGDGSISNAIELPMTVASLAKWALLLLSALTLLLAWTRLIRVRGSTVVVRVQWRRLVALRAQVVVVIVVGVVLLLRQDLGVQIIDVILRWNQDRWHIVVATVFLLVLTVVVALGGELLLRDHDRTARPGPPGVDRRGWLLITFLVALVALTYCFIVDTDTRWWLLPVAAGLLVNAMLSFPSKVWALSTGSLARSSRQPQVGHGGWVLVALVALPGVITGVLLLRAGLTLLIDDAGGHGLAGSLFVAGSLLAAFGVGCAAAWRVRRRQRYGGDLAHLPTDVRGIFVLLGSLVAVAVGLWIGNDAIEEGRRLGGIGVLLAFALCLGLICSGLTMLGNHWRTRGALAVVGLRRTPVLALVALLGSMFAAFDNDEYLFHDARLIDPGVETTTVEDAFDAWVAAATVGRSTDDAIPMVFVASAGGGIRAAYWTSITLGCLLGHEPPAADESTELACDGAIDEQKIFLASGVSGGSLGLVVSFATDPAEAAEHLSNDFLAPDLAQLLFVDAPNAWLRRDDWRDRAEILERSWEAEFVGGDQSLLTEGLFQWQQRNLGRKPILLLNGATVDDGCRLNVSAVDTAVPAGSPATAGSDAVGPLLDVSCTSLTRLTGTLDDEGSSVAGLADPALTRAKDLYDVACGRDDDTPHDVRLSTAALLSARFPFVSPSGGLYACPSSSPDGTAGPNDPDRNLRTYDVDGGVIEASGARALEETFTAVAPLVRDFNLDPLSAARAAVRRIAEARGATPEEVDAEVATVRAGPIEPRLIMLDNGYRSTARQDPADRQSELLLPLQEAGLAGQDASAAAQQDAAASFERFRAGSRPDDGNGPSVAYLYPIEDPGLRAPLGWTLSDYTESDMTRRLDSEWNRTQLELVRSWFAG